MKLLLITPEEQLPQEAEAITALFEKGLELLHLRKPSFNAEQLQQYLRAIPTCWYDRIVIHDQFELGIAEGISRLHLNRRSFRIPEKPGLKISRSCHAVEEIRNIDSYEYFFLSPIFNSISKTGYNSSFTDEELKEAAEKGIINSKIIALGGITKNNISRVADYGFGGVALIGSIWKDFAQTGDISALLNRYTELKTICEQL